MSISATTTPHVPPYSANTQMTSHRSSSSSFIRNPFVLLNSNFSAFMDDLMVISSALQSSSAEANGADSINTSISSSSYHPLDNFTSLYDQLLSPIETNPKSILGVAWTALDIHPICTCL